MLCSDVSGRCMVSYIHIPGVHSATISGTCLLLVLTILLTAADVHGALPFNEDETIDLPGNAYCYDFEARCPLPNEVIVMTYAVYGRMRFTGGQPRTCIDMKFDSRKCGADVLDMVHPLCSGVNRCHISVQQQSFATVSSCDSGLAMYLQAAYECRPVINGCLGTCRSFAGQIPSAEVVASQGLLAPGAMVQGATCGTEACPWRIEAQEGQRINITLHTYLRGMGYSMCTRVGVVTDLGSGTRTNICGSLIGSTTHVTLSQSHRVTIASTLQELALRQPGLQHIMKTDGVYSGIIIEFEVVGCPEFTAPKNTRIAKSLTSATVYCDQTNQQWNFNCTNGRWDKQIAVTCPAPVLVTDGSGSKGLPMGIMIAIIAGIALIIGVCILTIGLVYLKRQQHQAMRLQEVYTYSRRRESEMTADDSSSASAPLRAPKQTGTLRAKRTPLPPIPNQMQENVYMESRPLPSLPEEYAARELAAAQGGPGYGMGSPRAQGHDRRGSCGAQQHQQPSGPHSISAVASVHANPSSIPQQPPPPPAAAAQVPQQHLLHRQQSQPQQRPQQQPQHQRQRSQSSSSALAAAPAAPAATVPSGAHHQQQQQQQPIPGCHHQAPVTKGAAIAPLQHPPGRYNPRGARQPKQQPPPPPRRCTSPSQRSALAARRPAGPDSSSAGPPGSPTIIEDPAYFVLDPEAAASQQHPQPPQSLFDGPQSVPPLNDPNRTNSSSFPCEKQKSPEQENAENLDREEAAHNSCQDLPTNPQLQKLDPTKGNSSWP